MVKGMHNLPYDARRHITAAELRGLGFLLGENIPDEAYVRRLAVDLNSAEDLDDGSTRLGLLLLEPFQNMVPAEWAYAI